MLIRNILEESVQKFGEVKAVKWLNRKEVLERSYSEMMKNVISTRKGLLAEDFAGKHIALIGTSSIEWIESYLGIITGCTTAVPLDAALPCEELIDLINRSDSEALFLSPKHRPYLEAFLANCPKLQKVWMLQEEVEDVPSGVYSINELRNTGISASADASCPAAEDIATIIFTSGTTGKSKGVMLTQNNLASNVEAVKISAEPGTAMLSVLPIHHAFCLVMDWMKGFSQGATLCINDSLLHMIRNMSIFGTKVAVVYVLLGLVIAVVGGTLIEKLHLENQVEEFIRNAKQIDIPQEELAVKDRIKYAWEQVVETFKKVFPYILVGVGIGAFIHNWIPEDIIVRFLGTGNPFGVIIATIVGVPMYADIFGCIPIAEALLAKGARLGVVLSFMMGVTTLSLPSMIMLKKAIKPKLLGLFIGICTVGIIIVGYAFNAFQYLLI